MLSFEGFRRPDGTTDYAAHTRAEKESGHRCMTCGMLTSLISEPTGPRECYDCKALRNDAREVDHSGRVRCPQCGNTEEVDWESGLHEEGENPYDCSECGYEYTVDTSISFSFESPPLLQQPEDSSPPKTGDESSLGEREEAPIDNEDRAY